MATNNYAGWGILGAIVAALLGWGIYTETKAPSTQVGAAGCNSCGAMKQWMQQ